MQNIQKWVSFSFLAVGLVAWVVLRQAAEFTLGFLPWRFGTTWLIPLQDWVGVVGGLLLFVGLRRSIAASTYLAEVIGELSKVTWPAKKETLLSTGVVAVMVGIASFILLGFDTLWGTIVGFLYR